MNQQMWRNPATLANVTLLEQRGVTVCGPGVGAQACGDTGPGRMLEPEALVAAVADQSGSGALAGVKVLLTAGPTQEPIDPVRFITNRSSGKMGFALATAMRAAGADVVLVAGPASAPLPQGCKIIKVQSAADMHAAVMAEAGHCDIFIGAAAVADYSVAVPATSKVKKQGEVLTLTLQPTIDILATVAALPSPPFTVGFAAETEHLEDYARAKLEKKKLNLIAANLVGIPGTGFESDDNELNVYWPNGGIQLGKASKPALARSLVAVIAERYRGHLR
jgi:phosphopantothenoylcysteine decarboxylase/phosphopantothenate--cysteine ligase